MSERLGADETAADYLKTLEKTKTQYRQYLEIAKLNSLPTQVQEETECEQRVPSPEQPLTTNVFIVKKGT